MTAAILPFSRSWTSCPTFAWAPVWPSGLRRTTSSTFSSRGRTSSCTRPSSTTWQGRKKKCEALFSTWFLKLLMCVQRPAKHHGWSRDELCAVHQVVLRDHHRLHRGGFAHAAALQGRMGIHQGVRGREIQSFSCCQMTFLTKIWQLHTVPWRWREVGGQRSRRRPLLVRI